MNNINKIKSEVKKYILSASLAEIDEVKEDELIFENGLLDSMGLLFLIEFLDEKFAVKVSDEELNPKNFESIKSIVSFVNSKVLSSVNSK
jgi:acyl carrier protein